MAAASGSFNPPTLFSSCSIEILAWNLDHGMDSCLLNKPTQLIDGPVCGNGFVEAGEECDCVSENFCQEIFI